MKRTVRLYLGALLVAGLFGTAGWSQSLGEYARSVKKEKTQQTPAKKVYDNDNLPRTDHISTVGPVAEEQVTPAEATETPEQVQAGAEAKPKEEPKDGEKDWKGWRERIAKQKEVLALAERELDVLDREYRLRAAAFYADAGNRLRNQAQWDKQDSEYRSQSEQKKKQVEAEKKNLSDLQEEARKAGVPARYRD